MYRQWDSPYRRGQEGLPFAYISSDNQGVNGVVPLASLTTLTFKDSET